MCAFIDNQWCASDVDRAVNRADDRVLVGSKADIKHRRIVAAVPPSPNVRRSSRRGTSPVSDVAIYRPAPRPPRPGLLASARASQGLHQGDAAKSNEKNTASSEQIP